MCRNRLLYTMLVFSVMGTGLLWRSGLIPLSPFISKYGGDALWALMVFFGVGLLFNRITILRLALVALTFAWAIEFLQLYHAPWIDSIRAIRLGHLVLGTTFNWPDLLAYGVGVLVGTALEISGVSKPRPRTERTM